MERWLKAAAVEAAPVVDEQKVADRATAVKAEMARVWDAVATREDMLKHVEAWLAGATTSDRSGNVQSHGIAPVEVRGCVLREELYPLLVEVYQEKHPEDFAAAEVKPVGVVDDGLLEEPK